jgi:hypothetical protein
MKLDIKLALDRISKDYNEDKTFIKLPYELAIIKKNNVEWINSFEDDIINDRYAPGPMHICEVPKGNYHIRPGAHLSIEDAVYYTALVGEAYENIFESTIWARDRYDFSYTLTGDKYKAKWIRDNFNEWRNFRARSLDKIKQGYDYVLVADISGFYENINIQTLSYDLKQIGVANNIADAISNCLNNWAQNHGKGLPQGYSASNILAKLYLNSLDLRLKDDNFIHYRYVDDIRIFCKNLIEAKHALIMLTSLLHGRGLNLQTSKTKILCGKEAADYIQGVQPIIESILADLKSYEIKEETDASDIFLLEFVQSLQIATSDPYNDNDSPPPALGLEVVKDDPFNIFPTETESTFTEFEIVKSESTTQPLDNDTKQATTLFAADTATLESDPDTVDISIIKKTFKYFFIESKEAHFDKTLFRFLLKRLSKANDKFAVEFCKTLFERHPEETATLLKYFKDVNALKEAFEAIEIFLLSLNAIYHYQNYQVIEWMDTIESITPNDIVIALVRRLAFDNTQPYYLKSISRKYIRKFANASDLEMFEKLCRETKDPIEQAEMICIMQKMEKNRRNSTYARLGKKHILNKSAIIYVKSMDEDA